MSEPLFPEIESYIEKEGMLNKLKGNQAQIYRILGQGSSKSKELNMQPATIERKMEVDSFKVLQEAGVPVKVRDEVAAIRKELAQELDQLKKDETQKRLASQVLRSLTGVKSGNKDNRFFAGRLILTSNKGGTEWAWSLTSYYPIISNIPPDPLYIEKAYWAAEKLLTEIILAPDVFETRLNLAWLLARHFSIGDKVLIVDVARMYKVASQENKFWSNPKKGTFVEQFDAAFTANLIAWLKQPGEKSYSFAPATLHQAHGKNTKAFYLPGNAEGTQTRPVIYIDKK